VPLKTYLGRLVEYGGKEGERDGGKEGKEGKEGRKGGREEKDF